MDGDDFGLGPGELGIMLGMAQEMAKEEKERYRLLREMDDDAQWDQGDGREEESPAPRTRLYRGRPDTFMQYVDDYCAGRLTADAATPYGYDYREKIPRLDGPPTPPMSLGGVMVHRSHLVSTRLLEIIKRILGRFPNHLVNAVIFSDSGKPRIKGNPVFALYCRRSHTILFNLARHVDNAARIALDLNPSYSIRGVYWYSMLVSLLHELHHSILLQDVRYRGESARHAVEAEADRWSVDTLQALAAEMDIEPPPLHEEPFLQMRFNELLQQQDRRENTAWVKHQKLLVDANVLYWDAATQIAYPNMAALSGVMTSEQERDIQGLESIKDYGLKQDQQMAAAIKEEEDKEEKIRRAIATGQKVIVDYRDRYQRESNGRALFPLEIIYREGYWYVKAYCTERRASRLFRLDRIKSVRF
jgi:hypothetical protein